MKKDINSVKDVKLNELKEYIMRYDIDKKEEILCCWSMRSLLKIISSDKSLYHQMLQRLYESRTYQDMEYHLIMMNKLYNHYEYKEVKHDLLTKLLQRKIGLEEYLVIRHLIDDKEISLEYVIERLYQLNTSLIVIVKICLIEDEYELAYQYLRRMDYCDDETVLDLLCQYSPSLYCKLELHYYSKKKQTVLFQRLS